MLLYEIDARIASLVDPETGELMDYEAFARLQMEREEKVEGLALWVKDLTARAKAVKEEADALTERRRALEAETFYSSRPDTTLLRDTEEELRQLMALVTAGRLSREEAEKVYKA